MTRGRLLLVLVLASSAFAGCLSEGGSNPRTPDATDGSTDEPPANGSSPPAQNMTPQALVLDDCLITRILVRVPAQNADASLPPGYAHSAPSDGLATVMLRHSHCGRATIGDSLVDEAVSIAVYGLGVIPPAEHQREEAQHLAAGVIYTDSAAIMEWANMTRVRVVMAAISHTLQPMGDSLLDYASVVRPVGASGQGWEVDGTLDADSLDFSWARRALTTDGNATWGWDDTMSGRVTAKPEPGSVRLQGQGDLRQWFGGDTGAGLLDGLSDATHEAKPYA